MAWYVRRRIEGREIFDGLKPPVVFVANHSSHMDTPTILRALPRQWRQRTAVAAAADYFYRKRWVAAAVSLLFSTVPISRRGGGMDKGSADHLHRLLSKRWNLLLYPEGTRSRDGSRGKLHSGAAVLAAAHDVADPADLRRRHARGDAARALAGRAALRAGRPSAASRSACASARRSARCRASTATRRWPACRAWFDAQEGIVPSGAPLPRRRPPSRRPPRNGR